MYTSSNIKNVAKYLVTSFAEHIKGRVENKDFKYINLGVDNDFSVYESLFKLVMSEVLGLRKITERELPKNVVDESVTVINHGLVEEGHDKYLGNKLLTLCLYDICLTLLKSVKEIAYGTVEA